ncbi:MAG: hypothetical protein JSS79_05540 [Bacteroidetes bacterium]|nr:hypothetical protein [Bacteroidota bacterium]
MRSLVLLLLLLLTANLPSFCQSHTISVRIIDEFDLMPIPGVKIEIDTVQLGFTDKDGFFDGILPLGKNELTMSFLGMETTKIKIPEDCGRLEVVMMADMIYDYITTRKINKKREKRFKALPGKHRAAYEKGLFRSKAPCFNYTFVVF